MKSYKHHYITSIFVKELVLKQASRCLKTSEYHDQVIQSILVTAVDVRGFTKWQTSTLDRFLNWMDGVFQAAMPMLGNW